MGTFPTTSRSVSRDSPIPFLAKGACAPFGALLAPIRNPVTGAEVHPGAILPEGLIF